MILMYAILGLSTFAIGFRFMWRPPTAASMLGQAAYSAVAIVACLMAAYQGDYAISILMAIAAIAGVGLALTSRSWMHRGNP